MSPAATRALQRAIERAGYYPALVADSVLRMLGAEQPLAHVVHQETTLDDQMDVRRHVTVVVLTGGRLLWCHVDEHGPDGDADRPHALATTDAVPLDRIQLVGLTSVVADPATYVSGALPAEVTLAVEWGSRLRLDLEPAGCADEACEADHGYTGGATRDDLLLRVSAAGDGPEVVAETVALAAALSAATGR